MPGKDTPFLEYSDRSHLYFVDGKAMPSVTTILDAAGLVSQFSKDEEAAHRGTQVHAFTADDDAHGVDLRKVPTHLRPFLRAWRQFRKDTGFVPSLIEQRIDCMEFGYSGRFDRLGSRRGQTLLTLLDIKTSISGAVPDYARLQLAGYAFAYNPNQVFERMAVSLRPDSTYNVKIYPIASDRIDRAEWLGLVQLFNLQGQNNGNGKT